MMMMFMLIRYTKYKIAFISNHVNAQQKYEKTTLHVPVAHGADAASQVASGKWQDGKRHVLLAADRGRHRLHVARGGQGDNFAQRLEKFHFTPTRNDGENEANDMK